MGNLRGWHPALRYSAEASGVPSGNLRSWHPAFRLSSRLVDGTPYIVSGNADIRFFARISSDIRLHVSARSRL